MKSLVLFRHSTEDRFDKLLLLRSRQRRDTKRQSSLMTGRREIWIEHGDEM